MAARAGAGSGPVAEFCAGLRQLRQASGYDPVALARQLKISRTQLYAILNGDVKRPPDWTRFVGPLVEACTGGDARQVAEWRRRHAVLVGVFDELSRQDRQSRLPADDRVAGPLPGVQVVVGEIPREPAGFVARETLERLASVAGSGRVAVVCAVTGLRGVGKTQLAAAYARQRVREGWGLVGWVNAETPDAMQAGLARVAGRLGVADPEGDSAESARRLREHLQTRAGDGLLVFDNAAAPEMLRPFLPATGGTQVVVTSTDHAFAELGLAVNVTVFTRPESLGYLQARTGLADEGGATAVADELGDLPLGLAQAAATIRRQNLDYPGYLHRLRRVPVSALLGTVPGGDYPHATAAALLLSIQATEASDPSGLTGRLLRVVAVLSPDGVRSRPAGRARRAGWIRQQPRR